MLLLVIVISDGDQPDPVASMPITIANYAIQDLQEILEVNFSMQL